MYRIYVVDDEPLILDGFVKNPVFAENGYIVAGSSADPVFASKEIRKTFPDVVFTDLKMPGCSGLELMEELIESGIDCEFVIVSAYGEFEDSRRFFRMKGFDYIIKPVSDHDLQDLLGKLSGKLALKKAGGNAVDETPSPELNMMLADLRENFASKKSLEALSTKYRVNQNYICHLFTRHLGTTFVSYLTMLRMNKAASLLKNTHKSVKEIAGLCGYNDYFYFCRVFRDYYRCAPTTFREGSL